MGLATGIYENLIYEALKRKLEALPDEYRINYISIDPAQAPRMLTNYVASLMNRLLSDDRVFEEFEDKIAFVNKVVEFIDTKWDTEPDDDLLINEKAPGRHHQQHRQDRKTTQSNGDFPAEVRFHCKYPFHRKQP